MEAGVDGGGGVRGNGGETNGVVNEKREKKEDEADDYLTIEKAETELVALNLREREIELELERLHVKATHICQSETRTLKEIAVQHALVPDQLQELMESLRQTSEIAEELGSRVRKLDVVNS